MSNATPVQSVRVPKEDWVAGMEAVERKLYPKKFAWSVRVFCLLLKETDWLPDVIRIRGAQMDADDAARKKRQASGSSDAAA